MPEPFVRGILDAQRKVGRRRDAFASSMSPATTKCSTAHRSGRISSSPFSDEGTSLPAHHLAISLCKVLFGLRFHLFRPRSSLVVTCGSAMIPSNLTIRQSDNSARVLRAVVSSRPQSSASMARGAGPHEQTTCFTMLRFISRRRREPRILSLIRPRIERRYELTADLTTCHVACFCLVPSHCASRAQVIHYGTYDQCNNEHKIETVRLMRLGAKFDSDLAIDRLRPSARKTKPDGLIAGRGLPIPHVCRTGRDGNTARRPRRDRCTPEDYTPKDGNQR